jgi:hypothetical protein
MKSVEEKIADYILILEQLHKISKKDSEDYELFESLRQSAVGEEMVLRKVIKALKEIK